MSKLRLLVAACVACLAVGSVAIVSMAGAKPHHHHHHHKPKKVKVKTKVNLTYNPGQAPGTYTPYNPTYDPYGSNATFTGKVKAKKGCARRRSITVSQLGHTSSAKDGQFGFDVSGTSAPAGNYRIHVKGKSMKRGHGKHKRVIRCKPESKTLTIVSSS